MALWTLPLAWETLSEIVVTNQESHTNQSRTASASIE
jgi:hypothetical protein